MFLKSLNLVPAVMFPSTEEFLQLQLVKYLTFQMPPCARDYPLSFHFLSEAEVKMGFDLVKEMLVKN